MLYNVSIHDYPGTYWYHAHVDMQHLGGPEVLKGMIVVRPFGYEDETVGGNSRVS